MRTVVAPSGYLRADGKEVVKSEGPTLSRRTSSLARKHPWLRAAATVGMALLLAVSLAIHAHWLWQLLATAGLVIASYVWGFSDRAFSRPLWPPLSHLHRRQYADVWNSLASSEKDAPIAAAGYADDDSLRRSAAQAVGNLLDLASLDAREDVLEIGCGVGRIGAELAAHCRSWTGADISAHMLAQACRRLRETPNARCVLLRGASLSEFADHTFDVVYATNMLAHLDEMDRWLYLKDAFRVLRPGGRICIDNVDIESDSGWNMFLYDVRRYQFLERPPYMPRFSTSAELSTYARKAGFEKIECHRRPPLVILTAMKSPKRSGQA